MKREFDGFNKEYLVYEELGRRKKSVKVKPILPPLHDWPMHDAFAEAVERERKRLEAELRQRIWRGNEESQ